MISAECQEDIPILGRSETTKTGSVIFTKYLPGQSDFHSFQQKLDKLEVPLSRWPVAGESHR